VIPREHVCLTGTIEVGLPPTQAFDLFTPSGERAWAEGWDPQFPAPVADETEPGTVFTTDHGDQRTVWTVVRREAGTSITYSRTTAGDRAGLVTVTLRPSAGGSTVTVGYDLTALVPEADHALQRFAHHYPAFLVEWRDAIAAHLAPPSGGGVIDAQR
jgi:hypothetical protein